jgi:hypothetical protein
MGSLDFYQIYRNSENLAAILLSNNLLCNIALAAGTLVELSVKAAVPPKGPIGFCLPSTPSKRKHTVVQDTLDYKSFPLAFAQSPESPSQ